MPYKRRNISMTDEDSQLADQKARSLGLSFSALVRLAIRKLRVGK